jgi:basic amino acid/polyamine antiporter, APA family
VSTTTHELRRSLGVRDVALLTIGGVIGSGIFFVPGKVIRSAGGSLLLAHLAWIFGGVMALSGALTLAELGARRPDAGGMYVYIRDAFGRAPAFLFGWTILLAVGAGTVATLAVAFGDTAQRLFGLSGAAAKAVAIAAIVLLTVLNLGTARATAFLQGVSGAAKGGVLLGLAAIIVMAGPHPLAQPLPAAVTVVPGFTAIIASMVAVLWAYEGWQTVTYCAGEMRDPERVLPRGFVYGVVGLIVIYVTVNAACAYGLGAAGLSASRQPVADALAAVGHEGLARFVRVFVAFSILGAAHASLFTDSRVIYAMACDGLFFADFARVSERARIPQRAVLAIAACAILLALFNAFDALLSLVVVASWFFIGLAGAAVFVFRRREAAAANLFRVPLYPLVPAVFVLSSAAVVVSSWLTGPPTARYGLVVMILGWAVFAFWTRARVDRA